MMSDVADAPIAERMVMSIPLTPGALSAIPSTVTTPIHRALVQLQEDARQSGGGGGGGDSGSEGGLPLGDDSPHASSGEGLDTAAAAAAAQAAASIDRRPAIIGYFGYMFGGAAINAFFGLIFAEKGFSTPAIGLLVAIIPFFSVVLLPVLSFIADKYRCATTMLLTCAVISTAAVWIYTTASADWLVVVAFIVLVAAETPMNPLLDQHTLSMFPAPGRTDAWGYVRAFGAYGWGIGNPVAAKIVELAGTWSVAVVQYGVGQAALWYCMARTSPYEAVKPGAKVRVKDVLLIVGRNYRLLLFLLASCLMGMGYSFISNFLFIFLDEIGGTKMLMGLTLLLTVSTEIPIFQCNKYFHRWFTDRQMMSIAMGLWAIRVVGYSFLQNPWLVLLLEPLHGITFGFMWLPGVHIVNTVFPPQLASSATGVLFTFVCGIGPIVGNLVAGTLYAAVGPRWMFRYAAMAMAVGLVCYVVLDRMMEAHGMPLGASHDAAGDTRGSGGSGGDPADSVVVLQDSPAEEGKDSGQ